MVMDFEEVYKLNFDDVYRYIKRLSGDEHIAEEITSETFFRQCKKLIAFETIVIYVCGYVKSKKTVTILI